MKVCLSMKWCANVNDVLMWRLNNCFMKDDLTLSMQM